MNAFAALFADTKPMSAVEHRKSIEQNRLTYAIFARVIGVDARTARRFGDGSRKIPAVISGVLRRSPESSLRARWASSSS